MAIGIPSNPNDIFKQGVPQAPSAFNGTGSVVNMDPRKPNPIPVGGEISQNSSQASDLQSILRRLADSMEADLSAGRAQRDSLYSTIQGRSNPYGQGNPGLQSLLALQQGATRRGFADARDQTMRSLAQRGALGTAQETSALRRLAMDEARATSGNEARLRSGAYDQEQRFEALRDNQLTDLTGMFRGGGGLSTYASLLAREDGLANQAWSRQAHQDQQGQELIAGALRVLPFLLSAL